VSGVPFLACDVPCASNLTLHVLAAVAEAEAKSISDRTRLALAEAKKRGVLLGTHNAAIPRLSASARRTGQLNSAARRRDAAIECYADLVPAIHSLRAQGLSMAACAAAMNEAGNSSRNGAAFSASTIFHILRRAS
jgi:DNA invertase Pin-like site-specific DNA recombinase